MPKYYLSKRAACLLFLIVPVLAGALFAYPVQAKEDVPKQTAKEHDITSAHVSIFGRDNCPNCQDLEVFLQEQKASSPFSVKYYDLGYKPNMQLFERFTSTHDIAKVTPITLIGDTVIVGFDNADTTGKQMQNLLAKDPKKTSFAAALSKDLSIGQSGQVCSEDDENCTIPSQRIQSVSIPFIWSIDISRFSISAVSLVLGFVDGFNPCAMWVLLLFLGLLFQVENKRKMLFIISVFLVSEAVLYYAILRFWHATWNFIKLDNIVTPVIGVLALGAGLFFLWEFFAKKDTECNVSSSEQKRKITQKLHNLAHAPLTIGVFLGIVGIAFSINIIEFACSIGIPQSFTKMLELSSLGFWEVQWQMLLYMFTYMLDDLIILFVALWWFKYVQKTTWYTRYCLLIGGLLMVIIAYFFLFAPGVIQGIG